MKTLTSSSWRATRACGLAGVEAKEMVSTEDVAHARDATPDRGDCRGCGDCGKQNGPIVADPSTAESRRNVIPTSVFRQSQRLGDDEPTLNSESEPIDSGRVDSGRVAPVRVDPARRPRSG